MNRIKISEVWRKNTSVNGNPSFYVSFTEEDGNNVFTAYTAPDSSCGYSIQNYRIGDLIKADYHFTKKGNCIITRIG